MSVNVELLEMLEEQLDVRRDEEYAMGSLNVRRGASVALRFESG